MLRNRFRAQQYSLHVVDTSSESRISWREMSDTRTYLDAQKRAQLPFCKEEERARPLLQQHLLLLLPPPQRLSHFVTGSTPLVS